MAQFEHPLQLFSLEYPDGWEMRYQEDTGGVILVHPGLEDASALSLSPIAVTGLQSEPAEDLVRAAARLGVAISREDVRTEHREGTDVAYGEGLRQADESNEALAIGPRFRFWMIRHGALTINAAQLGPGAAQAPQREAADAAIRSLAFPEILPPTPEEFRQRVVEVLGREYPDVRPAPSGEWAIELTDAEGNPTGTLGLENLYRSCLLNAESAGALIREYLDQVLGSFADLPDYDHYELVRPRLLPMLKSEAWVRDVPDGLELASIPFAEGIVICFAIDEPSRLAYVTQDMLAKWDVPLERVQEVSQDNLAGKQGGLELTVLNGQDNRPIALVVNTGDGYDATRILLPAVREAFEEELGEEYLVGLPNRDFLIAFSERDPAMAAGIMRQVRQDYHKMHHPLTPTIYRVRADRFEPVRE
jgi:uncharacterized protein YtpQ (UPF0354 family)